MQTFARQTVISRKKQQVKNYLCYGNRKKKTEKKYLKLFSSKTTDQILMKHIRNINVIWGANDTEQNFDFI